MVRIAGIDLEKNKQISYALTKIYGIGLVTSKNILQKANIPFSIRSNDLNDQNISSIRDILESHYIVESNLRRKINLNIKRLSEINCIRGKRHRQHLPLRGQRTRTNARTNRGSKKTVTTKKTK
jgi:small subunit ribosomal protein S13